MIPSLSWTVSSAPHATHRNASSVPTTGPDPPRRKIPRAAPGKQATLRWPGRRETDAGPERAILDSTAPGPPDDRERIRHSCWRPGTGGDGDVRPCERRHPIGIKRSTRDIRRVVSGRCKDVIPHKSSETVVSSSEQVFDATTRDGVDRGVSDKTAPQVVEEVEIRFRADGISKLPSKAAGRP